MSKQAKAFLNLWKMGRVSEAALQKAVYDGVLTAAEATLILGS